MKTNPEKLTTVRIEVTERLIKTGTVNDRTDCPFARAMKKVVANGVDVHVDYDTITLQLPWTPGEDTQYQCISTPATVSKFMEKIDGRDPWLLCEGCDESAPVELPPPLPKPFSINLKIRNKFLRPSLRA